MDGLTMYSTVPIVKVNFLGNTSVLWAMAVSSTAIRKIDPVVRRARCVSRTGQRHCTGGSVKSTTLRMVKGAVCEDVGKRRSAL